MALTEDFATFFNTSDFASSATVGGVAVSGIFDNEYATAMGFVAGSSPVLLVASSAAASAAPGDAVTVGGASYLITALEPDGSGVTLLRLQESGSAFSAGLSGGFGA